MIAAAYDTHVEQLGLPPDSTREDLDRAREGSGADEANELPPQRLSHIQDLDSVELITPEIEALLPEILRQRRAEVRAATKPVSSSEQRRPTLRGRSRAR